MYKIAITNRKLCSNIIEKIPSLTEYKYVILREKDLSTNEYYNLAKKAIAVSDKIILHSFIDVAINLEYYKIHIPFNIFIKNIETLNNFDIVGVSTHSKEEAKICEKLGADYITYSHIFETDCKKGLKPKGLLALADVCSSVNIPVYALGGINEKNSKLCIEAGAKGVCMMSQAMK